MAGEFITLIIYILSKLSIIHRARPHRDMTDTEKKELHEYYEKHGGDMDVYPLSGVNVTAFLLVIALFIIVIFMALSTSPNPLGLPGWVGFISIVTCFGLLAGLFIYGEYRGKVEYDKKREYTMPVYMIMGRLHDEYENKKKTGFSIGRYYFALETLNSEILNSLNSFKEGNSVMVEFSPYTHYVWKIEKME